MNFKTLLLFVLGIVILGGLFFVFKPQEKQTNTPQTTQSTAASPTPVDKTKTFELVFKNKKLVSGESAIKVEEGDKVVIKATSDTEEELHLHGYDVSIDLEKDKQAELSFTANLSGRFPYELEHSGTEIGAVEVEPK